MAPMNGIAKLDDMIKSVGTYVAEGVIEKAVPSAGTVDVRGVYELPKPYHFWGLKIPAYSHPRVQAVMLGFVLFITVGMYNVITFIGGAGQQTAWLASIANFALYTVFVAFCFVAPACLNFFGLRPVLCFGGFGYAAYVSSLWCFNHTGNVPFVIFGGCWCGLSAAFFERQGRRH